MTLKELSQLYWLKKEIRQDRRRLEDLRIRAAGVPSPAADGMPRGSEVHSRVEHAAVAIVDIERIISAKLERCEAEQAKLEAFIAGIDDSLTRQVFKARFVDGKTWRGVAYAVGGGNTADGVKKTCYRYLRRVEESEQKVQ